MKILLNSLPPADIHNPSISLSILKKFMDDRGIETAIKYWNFQLSYMPEFTDSEDTEIRLIPFLSIINDRHGNHKGNNRILSLLQRIAPEHKSVDSNYYSEFLEEKKEEIISAIKEEVAAIDFSGIQLLGITAKYSQWIPGMLLAEEVKKVAPHVKVVVGGFGSRDAAYELMKTCADFDFATWGEGEFVLLELTNRLNNRAEEFKEVPRLIYRKGEELIQSETNKSEYLDFNNYIYPDYSDFIENYPYPDDTDLINIPINTIRACHWGKCKFCDFNKGYKLRERTPECIVGEIEDITNKYGITTYSFVDSDTFGSPEHFEKLLDLIIDLKYRTEEDFIFWAEIIPNIRFNTCMMEKMAIAGFKNIFIGYDGLSDGLLKKMNKSNSFSDNIFFVKQCLKNGLSPMVNVIKHLPEETEEDIQECMHNLHYLRFYYNDSIVKFSHNYVDLVLSSMTKYYAAMPEVEREKYNSDDLSYLLPDSFSESNDRFHLFRYKSSLPSNNREWNNLIETEEYYKSNRFNYKIQINKGVLYYTEYCNDTEIENIVFGQPEYGYVLKALEDKVNTFEELYTAIKELSPALTENNLKGILKVLKDAFIIYCNDEYSNVVSVVSIG